MEEKSNIGWIVVAIVAIVAIVGLVLLFKGGGLTGNIVNMPTLQSCQGISAEAGKTSFCRCMLEGTMYNDVIVFVQSDWGKCPEDFTTLQSWYRSLERILPKK